MYPGPAPIPKVTNSHMIIVTLCTHSRSIARAQTHTHSLRGPKATAHCPQSARWVNSGPFCLVSVTEVTASSCQHKSAHFGALCWDQGLPGQSVFASHGHFTHVYSLSLF